MDKMISKYFVLWIGLSCLFVLLIMFVSQYYVHAPFIPDQGASWYYWQLPEINQVGRILGWVFFISHLMTTLFLTWKIKKEGQFNIFGKLPKLLFISQVVFILLHLIHSYFWYDSLVKDTPVWLSQFSVIIMLVLMLGILNPKRGLFFGKKVPIPSNIVKAFIDFHGIFIITATIFTFWYHPMESTVGHLIGFFYMFMLFGQIIFASTKIHFNRIWVFLLEFTVLIHGTVIAMQSVNLPAVGASKIMWPMFAFGFGAIAVITQIYYLRLPKSVMIAINAIYILMVGLVYSGVLFGVRTFDKIYEISFIPLIEYLLVFVFVGIAWIYFKMKIRKTQGNS